MGAARLSVRTAMKLLLFGFAFVANTALPAPAGFAILRDGPMEKAALVDPSDPKTWSAAECTAAPSSDRFKAGTGSWHWHVAVDYYAGEPKYPIGWPRITHAIPPGALRDWSDWDFLHAWIYVETSRAALPAEPAGLGLQTPDRASSYNRPLVELKKDQWVELNLPVRDIPQHRDVRSVQFHIAEANYQHGDGLDFYVNDLSLTRYAEPTAFRLELENGVLFSDAARLAVRFDVLGLKPGDHAKAGCELRLGEKVLAHTEAEVVRGTQRVILELGRQTLAPGEYEVSVSIAGRSSPIRAAVRVVESPWSSR
jgi:hypothetical protein